MLTFKRIKLHHFFIILILLSYHQSFSRGASCEDPIDLNTDYPIVDNGHQQIPVNNAESSQFYTYTASKEGTLKMWSGFANAPGDGSFETDLRVYQTSCNNLIADIDNSPGLFGNCEFEVDVEIGDTYIFEWSNHNWGGQFNADYYFQESVNAASCDDPVSLQCGINHHDSFFKNQYFEYTASKSGVLEISTCGIPNAYTIFGFDLLSQCLDLLSVDYNYDCDPDEEYDWFTLTYAITEGETITIETPSRNHDPYDFNAVLVEEDCDEGLAEGGSCDDPIDLNTAFRIIGNGHQQIPVNNSESSQFYTYTATKKGTLKMWSGFANAPGDPSFGTDLIVYQTTCENLIADIDFSPGLLGGCEFQVDVEMDDTYIFEWSNHKWAGQFNADYYFQEPVNGISCDNPSVLSRGNNHHDSFFKNQYFEYTASKSGVLEISTCDIINAYAIYGFDLLNECLNVVSVDFNYDCDPDEDYDWFTLSYAISEGETITIETPSRNHDPYDFNAVFIADGGCNQWLGTSSDWFDTNNWSNGFLPHEMDEVLIDVTANHPIIIGEGVTGNLIIADQATLTIESGSSLSVYGNVKGLGETIFRRKMVGNSGYSIIGSPIQNAEIEEFDFDHLYGFDGVDYVVPDGQLNPGDGYFAGFNQPEPLLEFKGKLNHGTITKTLDQAGEFKLLSNPYASAIEKNVFIFYNSAQIGSTIYLWDDGGVNDGTVRGGGFVTVSAIGVTGNAGLKGSGIWTGNIPSAQGFYVFVEQTGTIEFDPNFQNSELDSNGDGGFYRVANETKTIRLSLSNDEYKDDLLIGFMEEATTGIDQGLDARKLRNNHVSFFSLADKIELAIQALDWKSEIHIPLGYSINEPGNYEITASDLDGIENGIELILVDKHSGQQYNLLESPAMLALSKKEESERFVLLIKEQVLSIKEWSGVSIIPSSESIQINYRSDNEEPVLISTVGGKILFNDKVNFSTGQATIAQQFSPNTIYLVRIKNQTIKYIINK